YGAAKARLFNVPGLRCRVINLDDGFGRALAGEGRESRLITYSLEDPSAYLYCAEARLDDDGIHARLITPQGERSMRSPLLGRFNVSNVLAAVGALLGMDYALDEILAVLPELEGPAGRMQRLGGGDHPLIVVDYAHTPDALTDDNPRNEAPERIVEDIRSGFVNPAAVTFAHGRAQAIAGLIATAHAEDVVVLAGKGHEDYQEIRGERLPFSDIEEACRALSIWEKPNA
ncbi:MAG: UDP-N-acetylmuramoyl-L-alanyl-D-glutamate--2,6-diaminopimelate ligase, partial [Gammaproteobacteria bacterium HGW-Gammaproteobacteria-9]